MKKTSRIFALLLAVGLVTVMLASCSKTPADLNTFKEISQKKGYSMVDALSQFTDTPQVKEAVISIPDGKAFQIEFYVLDSSTFASTFYNNLSNVIEEQKGSIHSGSSFSGKNYAKRTITTGGRYSMVEYIENTLVYVPFTDASNKSAIEEFLKEMNY